ncbi:enoyl-CoA hydratase [Hydrocarboniphaga effusa]|jgi:enoyl-CoA hydratase/carnithine racemase|uniref:enoyl-CoA hydratase n=1 Tax=Hydrocarboniphaga effusa TaxID=243629 RepID=UPI0031383112
MSEALIQTSITDGVMTLRLNRADKKNSLTATMYTALAEAFDQAAADSSVRVVLITGSGDSFCAGNDLVDFLQNTPSDAEQAPVMVFMRTMSSFKKPIVAAVNGIAVGVGVTMLLHCDLVYAADNARFQLPFASIGICPEFGSTLLLPMMIGPARASELCLLGEMFNAQTAKDAGIVNGVAPAAELEALARAQAEKLSRQPPNALRTTKALLKRWTQDRMPEVIRSEAAEFMPMLKMPEALEAMGAFMQKRKPDFSKFS